MESGIVKIGQREYKTVAKRVADFREVHGSDLSIVTEVICNADLVVFRAEIRDASGRVIASGHAEEKRGSTQINKTSALENCETSAIGRALACFGLSGSEYASADEVAQAIAQQNSHPTTKEQLWLACRRDAGYLRELSNEEFGINPHELAEWQMMKLIETRLGGGQ